MLERREVAHADGDAALQAALVRALEENEMLRRALEEQLHAPRARRWIGRGIAVVILLTGIAGGALYFQRSDGAREFRRGMQAGYQRGVVDGRANRSADAPSPPSPPPPPSPSSPP